MERPKPEGGCMDFLGRSRDVLAAVLFVVFSAAVFFSTGSIRVFAPNSPSYINAQFFPYLLSSILGVVSVIQLVIAIRKLPEAKAGGEMNRLGILRIALTLILLAAYVALLKDVGFLVTTAVYVFFQALILTPRERLNVKFSLGLAVVSSSVIYFLFTHVLSLMLPRAAFMPF
jgi:putative tricarboxylic transport membrane protein